MKVRFFMAAVALSLLAACNVPAPSQDTVREKTADATNAIKHDTKAMAEGIKEGWNRDKQVDVNSATSEQLQTLPGIDHAKATLIIRHRPYSSGDALVTKKVLSQQEYEQIAGKIRTR